MKKGEGGSLIPTGVPIANGDEETTTIAARMHPEQICPKGLCHTEAGYSMIWTRADHQPQQDYFALPTPQKETV
jgi:hypothetical protein